MRLIACTLCALLLAARAAPAETVWTGTNYRIDVSARAAVGFGLEAITLQAVGLNGALPNSFDGTTSGTGITTAGDELYQVFEFSPVTGAPTPTLDTILVANEVFRPLDTHFIVEPPAIISIDDPDEDQNTADNVLAANGGFGSFLNGRFVLTGTPPPTWDFAYLVAERGTEISLDFRIADGGGDHGQYPFETVQGSFIVPEPATVCMWAVGLLAMGFVALTRRRR